ncbi:hypothetical protein EC957_008371, partial [Mortierella hygrophila]
MLDQQHRHFEHQQREWKNYPQEQQWTVQHVPDQKERAQWKLRQEQELTDVIQVFEQQQVPLRVQEFKKQFRQDQRTFAQPHQLLQKQYQLLQQQIQQ